MLASAGARARQSLPGATEPFACRRGSSGSPAPPPPLRRPYRPRHLSEFPVSPHLRREPRSRSSGNTPKLQRVSRNKERDRQPSLLLVPSRKRCTPASSSGLGGQVGQERAPAESTHRNDPRHRPLRRMARGLAEQPAHRATAKGSQARSTHQPHGGRSAGLSPARTCRARAARTWPHLLPPRPARGAIRSLLGPPAPPGVPAVRAAHLRRSGARGPPAPSPSASASYLARVFLCPAPESPALPGSRFNPGRRCPGAQGDTPERGAGSPRAGGGDRAELFRLGGAGGVCTEEARHPLDGWEERISLPAALDRASRRLFAARGLEFGSRQGILGSAGAVAARAPGGGPHGLVPTAPRGLCALGAHPGVGPRGPLAPATRPAPPTVHLSLPSGPKSRSSL